MTKNDEKLNDKQAPFGSCQTNRVVPKKRTARVIIAIAISIYLLAILFFEELLVCGLFESFAFLSFITLFPLVTLFSYVTYFRQDENAAKARIFIFGSLSALFIVGISTFFDIWIHPRITWSLSLLLFPLAVISGIITNAVSFARKSKLGYFSTIFLILMFIMTLPTWLSVVLPRVYTPHVLTSDRLLTYNQCIQFVRDHDEYKDITLFRQGWASYKTGFSVSIFGYNNNLQVFSKDELAEMKALWKRLSRELIALKFQKAQRDSNMLLFYTRGNRILPVPPGVLYSLDGENPNTIDSELLNAAKPFIKISGDWYMSRRLVLRGPRINIPTYTPKSLIDHSLRIEGLNFEKPHTSNTRS